VPAAWPGHARSEEVFGHVEVNTKDLVVKANAHERATATLRVIQYMLAATVAFDIVDRLTALDLSVFVDMSTANMGGTPEWQRSIVTNLIYQPGMWFLVNMLAAAFLILAMGACLAPRTARHTRTTPATCYLLLPLLACRS
jgi:hypothetical protein